MTAALPEVRDRSRAGAAAETVFVALVLGVLADLLFHGASLGLNAPLWLGALVGALLYAGRHRGSGGSLVEVACLALSLAAAAALAWRASEALQALLFLASGAFLVLAVAIRSGLPWRRTGVALFLGAMVASGIAIAAGLYRVQSRLELRNHALRRSKEGAGTVTRSLVLGGPVLLVFALLFASADAVFEDRLAGLVGFDVAPLLQHLFWLLAGAWFAGGVTWATVEGRLVTAPERQLPEARLLKSSEVATILGALALLFAAFVAVQLRYHFGGHDVVQDTLGLTYAEYARRGFFELVVAAVLLLPLLLVADWARRHGGGADAIFRGLAGLLVALLFVVMASALQRMRVYEEAYGLTEDRLYAVAVLLGLAVVFVLFLRTLIAGRNDWFVAGSIAAAAVVLGVLTLIGPDGVIAERNIERASVEHPFDADYAASLDADAVPVLARRLGELSPDDAGIVACSLLGEWGEGSGDGWRSWNWSRAEAARAVEAASADLERDCESVS